MFPKNPSVVRLAIADDHALVRQGVCELISHFGSFIVDMQAGNGLELIRQLERAEQLPDICILDINMPVKNGYETLIEVRKRWPSIKFLVLTMFYNEFALIRMLRSGANGYLLKDCTAIDLKNALLSIDRTGYYYSGNISGHIYHSINNDSKRLSRITDRETKFLFLCCNDLGYKEIADLMSVSTRTVEGYRDALFEKLNLRSRIGLVMYAMRTGIVPLF